MSLRTKAAATATALAVVSTGIIAPAAHAATATPENGGCRIVTTEEENLHIKGGINRFYSKDELPELRLIASRTAAHSKTYAEGLRTQLKEATDPYRKKELERQIILADNDVIYQNRMVKLYEACQDGRPATEDLRPATKVPPQPIPQSPFENWGSSVLGIVDQIVEFFAQLANLPIIAQLRDMFAK